MKCYYVSMFVFSHKLKLSANVRRNETQIVYSETTNNETDITKSVIICTFNTHKVTI